MTSFDQFISTSERHHADPHDKEYVGPHREPQTRSRTCRFQPQNQIPYKQERPPSLLNSQIPYTAKKLKNILLILHPFTADGLQAIQQRFRGLTPKLVPMNVRTQANYCMHDGLQSIAIAYRTSSSGPSLFSFPVPCNPPGFTLKKACILQLLLLSILLPGGPPGLLSTGSAPAVHLVRVVG
jgi:hypothetical protein